MELLCDLGARIGLKTRTGWTALHYAAFADSAPVARVLVQRGADLNGKQLLTQPSVCLLLFSL